MDRVCGLEKVSSIKRSAEYAYKGPTCMVITWHGKDKTDAMLILVSY